MTTSTSRRKVLTSSAALVGAASSTLLIPAQSQAQTGKIRVGLMLPYSGAFAPLGVAIENGVRMAINEQGGKLGGREIEWFKVDDESDPSKGIENANKLVQRDKVHFTREGYLILGDLFFNALMKNFEQYMQEKKLSTANKK
jgi:branched-chain amino acid transport system substrate-binding protein